MCSQNISTLHHKVYTSQICLIKTVIVKDRNYTFVLCKKDSNNNLRSQKSHQVGVCVCVLKIRTLVAVFVHHPLPLNSELFCDDSVSASSGWTDTFLRVSPQDVSNKSFRSTANATSQAVSLGNSISCGFSATIATKCGPQKTFGNRYGHHVISNTEHQHYIPLFLNFAS